MEVAIILFVILSVILFSYCSYGNEKDINKIKYVPNTNIIVKDTLIELINEYRIEQNLCPLLPEKILMDVSKERVAFLKTQDTLTHNGFVTISESIGANSLGEIVGKKYNTSLGLFKGYQKSPLHNSVMLKDFKYIGSFTEDTYNCVLFAK